MSSGLPLRKLIIDPMMTPPPTTSLPAPPRRAMLGAETHNVRVTSALLPDPPYSSPSPPLGEVWLPRLDGGQKLHIEQSEPAWVTGAHGQPNPARIDYPADWRTQHAALRAKNLIRRTSRSNLVKSELVSGAIKVNTEAFKQRPTTLGSPYTVASAGGICGGNCPLGLSRAVKKGENLEFISPSPIRNVVETLETDTKYNHLFNRGTDNLCARRGCPGCSKCGQDRAQGPDRGRSILRSSQRQPNLSRFSGNGYAPDAILNRSSREQSLDRMSVYATESPTPKEPAFNITEQENPIATAARDKGSRFKLLGKINFLAGWRKKNFDIVPRNRHYSGCILCTPQPSPRSSLTSSVVEEEQGLYPPSRQNPGPPPLTPPPSLKTKGTKGKAIPPNPPISPTRFNPVRNLLNQSEEIGGDFGEPGPSNQSVYGQVQPDGQNKYPESPHEGTNNYPQAQGSTVVGLHPQDISTNLSPTGSVNNLTGASNLDDGGGFVRKKGYTSQSSQIGSINVPGGDVHCRRPSLFSVLQGNPASDREKGIKRLPLSNRPTFLRNGNRGVMRLPDDESEGHHPGVRIDHQYVGTDGVYEMVDLSNEPSPVVVSPVPLTKWQLRMETVKKPFLDLSAKIKDPKTPLFKSRVLIVLLVIGILMAAVIACVVLFVIPAVTQNKVNKAKTEVTGLHITDIKYNYTSIDLDLSITSGANVRTSIKPTMFSLASDNVKNFDFFFGKKPGTASDLSKKYTTLGNLWLLDETILQKGDGHLVLKSSNGDAVGFSADYPTAIKNLADMAEGLIWGPYNKERGMSMAIQGDMHMQVQGYNSGVSVSKEITISSMGGFQEFKIDAYQLLQPENGFMVANVTWFNPSTIQMDLGDVEFDLFFGDLAIGNAIIPSMKIIPGDNIARLSSTLFENSILRNNKTLLGEFMSSLATQEPGSNSTKILHLEGRTTSFGGFKILWLLPAVQSFHKDLSMPGSTRMITSLNSDMRLSMDTNSKVNLQVASFGCEFKLPFESDNFSIAVYGVGYTLKMSLQSHKDLEFLRLESKVNARNITALSGVHTLNSSLIGSSSGITEDRVFREVFMPDFITSKTVPIEVIGSMIVDLNTPFGDGRVSGVEIEKDVWQIKGLHNLDGGNERKIIITTRTIMGSAWTLGLQIENPSDMFMNFGQAEFDVIEKKGSIGCIGTVSVQELVLDYGSNTIKATFDSAAPHCNLSDTENFLSSYLHGGRNDIFLRTTSHHEIKGLTGLEIGAAWVSPGYHLIEFIDFVVRGNKVKAQIKLKNPFDTILTLDSLDIEFILQGNNTVIAAIGHQKTRRETIMGGYSRILSEIPVIPMMSLQSLVGIFRREILGDAPRMLLTVSGSMRLILADYEAPAFQYTQEGVEVKLKWED